MEILQPTVQFNPKIKGRIFHINGFLEDVSLDGYYLVKYVAGENITVLPLDRPNCEYQISTSDIQNEELTVFKLMDLVEAK